MNTAEINRRKQTAFERYPVLAYGVTLTAHVHMGGRSVDWARAEAVNDLVEQMTQRGLTSIAIDRDSAEMQLWADDTAQLTLIMKGVAA